MLRTNPAIEEFSVNFRERLQAMAAMHELLSGENWRTVNLRSLAAIALDPYVGRNQQNVFMEGPDILLNPKSAGTLTMALHELATNAAKYGALSSPTGRLNLHWAIDGDSGIRQVVIRWREHGGPVVGEPPAKDGFGTAFVKRSIAYELNGSVALRFERDGLNATITFPASEAEERLTW
jgi:two-component system CheB/CheR fusion protein